MPNDAHNVIPAVAKARDLDPLQRSAFGRIAVREGRRIAEKHGGNALPIISGEPFLTPPGAFRHAIVAAVKAETGVDPEPSTTGGTSDARFLRASAR